MKSKLKVCLLVVGALLLTILTTVLSGCVAPAASSPAPAAPAPAPIVPVTPAPLPPVVEPQPLPEPATEVRRVDVVFFHRTQQCHSCEYAEVQVQKTLEKSFANEMASGLVTSQSINMDDEKNTAIVKKYAAYSSQLFITTVKGDEEVTEEVLAFWDFIDNDEGFSNMIIDKVNEALESAGL